MNLPFLSHPLRVLLVSAIGGIGVTCLLLFTVLQWWSVQHREEAFTPQAHTDALWERERLQEIDNMPRLALPPREPDAPPPSADAILVRTLDTLRRRIEERYDVEIVMYDTGFLKKEGIDAHPYPLASLEEHLRSLNDWIRIYPPEYIKRSGLKTIALFKGWEEDGVQTAGFLIDRSTIGMEASQGVFHHELFHLADMTDGGMENDNAEWLQRKYGEDIPVQPTFDALQAIAKKLHEE